MQDFLRNIFSRGSFARTDSPVVVIGGVSSNSASLTIDVAHFDGTGNLLVNVAVGGGGSISGTVTATVIAGTMTVQALLAGTVTAQALLAGTVSALWAQRLDATNDAILNYAQARTSDPVAATNGSNTPMISDSLGKIVVLPGSVNDRHLDGDLEKAGVLTSQLIASQGTGIRIAVQNVFVSGSGSQIAAIVLAGGPSNRTLGYLNPTGNFQIEAGAAALYITSASAALSAFGSVTTTFHIFASGYALSN